MEENVLASYGADSTSAPPELGQFDCSSEELSDVQKLYYEKFNNFFATLSKSNLQSTSESSRSLVALPISQSSGSAPSSQQLIIPSPNGFSNGGYVVVDPNVKVFVSNSTVSPRAPVRLASSINVTAPSTRVVVSPKPRQSVAMARGVSSPRMTLSTASRGSKTPTTGQRTPIVLAGQRMGTVPAGPRTPTTPAATPPVVDLTDDNSTGRSSLYVVAPEEIPQMVPSFKQGNKKTYPSLAVTARPSLSSKLFPPEMTNRERAELDNKLRKIINLTASGLIELLLQQRLLKCDQYCSEHPKQKLKLGMYSDVSRFPFTGGYVWISDCCPGTYTSVFRGSIFEVGALSPQVILKLLYHWACQTPVPNVMQWVSVDSNFLKTFYTYLRAACTASIHEKYGLLGGAGQKIEVGVISLGTSTAGGSSVRDVKVDILGAMDFESKKLRLRALDHLNMSDGIKRPTDVYAKKCERILEVLQKWVHPKALIVTDFTIDRSLCLSYGFTNMITSMQNTGSSNSHMMEYLRVVIPRMFQNTLNLLSRHLIQQFLDELVWRETWGQIAQRSYDKITEHLAEQTKLEGPDEISVRYTLIASNPTRDWRYSNWAIQMPKKTSNLTNVTALGRTSTVTATRKRLIPSIIPKNKISTLPAIINQAAVNQAGGDYELAKIALEPYYYGSIPGDESKQTPSGLFGVCLSQCHFCGKDLFNSLHFTNHLVTHALNDADTITATPPTVKNSLRTICRFCLRPTVLIESHVKQYHKESHLTTPTMCKICNTIHKDSQSLISHMTFTHCELDMPYFCEICRFRTSVYQDMLLHFDKMHNKDSCVQCPFCLKVVLLTLSTGEDIIRNQIYFVQHIQKHTIIKNVRKCEKCVLSFTNLATLKNHQEYFHVSCANIDSVERFDCDPNDLTLMAAPLVDPPAPMSLSDADNLHTLKGKPLAPSIKVSPELKMFLCAECDGPITPSHFFVKMTCTRCPFQTCCANAIKEHNVMMHQSSTGMTALQRPPLIGGRALMEKRLYCAGCTYSSSNGNSMATHLETCEVSDGLATADKRKGSELQDVQEEFLRRKNKE